MEGKTLAQNRFYRGFILFACLLISGFTTLPLTVYAQDTSKDAYLNGSYYNKLVSDGDFIDINGMSVSEIQSFLEGKGSALATAPSDRLGNGADGRSAAQIIWDASHGHREASGTLNGISINSSTGTVNPKVLLVTLQKEMSLVTHPTLEDNRLRVAMGYGCPDGAACDERYYGFTNQIEWAAWQLRYNYEAAAKDSSWWTSYYGSQPHYYKGYSRSHGWAIGGTTTYYIVTYNNQSTASLYRYTPHVGYGNYNFWWLMIEWFGAATVSGSTEQLEINDTEAISQATYKTRFKYSGVKRSDMKVYFNGSQVADIGSRDWTVEFEPLLGQHNYIVEYKTGGGTSDSTKIITVDRRKVGDVNGDVRVDLLDLSLLSDSWGLTVQDDASLNLNPEIDNIVDLLDISLLGDNYEG